MLTNMSVLAFPPARATRTDYLHMTGYEFRLCECIDTTCDGIRADSTDQVDQKKGAIFDVRDWLECVISRSYNPSPGEGGSKNWVGVCGLLTKILTLSITKTYDFPYPIHDLTKTLISYL